jgi:hypothetical protein
VDGRASFPFKEKIELYERARMTRDGVDEGSIPRFEILSGGEERGQFKLFFNRRDNDTIIVSLTIMDWHTGNSDD